MTAHVNCKSRDSVCRYIVGVFDYFPGYAIANCGFLLFEVNGSNGLALAKYLQAILTSFVYVLCFSDVDF